MSNNEINKNIEEKQVYKDIKGIGALSSIIFTLISILIMAILSHFIT